MSSFSVARTNGLETVLDHWRKVTGTVYESYLIARDGNPTYRVKSARGLWYLQLQPRDTSEDELAQANAFFQELRKSPCPVLPGFLLNDRDCLGTRMNGECWTLSALSPKAVFNTPWLCEEQNTKMADGAAEALAYVHAYGLLHIRRAGLPQSSEIELATLVSQLDRFNKFSRAIYSHKPAAWPASGKHPITLFQTLVPEYPLEAADQRVLVIDNSGEPESFSEYQEEKIADAELVWMRSGLRGPMCWHSLYHRFYQTVSALRQEERALGYPRTIVHGNYAMNNLQYDDDKLERITGWQGFQALSPLYDLAYAGVMLSVKWSHPSRPHDVVSAGDFDEEKFGRFVGYYHDCMLKLCGKAVMSSDFGSAIESTTLLQNYMRVACYRILLEQLENDSAGNPGFDIRCRVITQILHVERMLWM
jgi:hypothetical protein